MLGESGGALLRDQEVAAGTYVPVDQPDRTGGIMTPLESCLDGFVVPDGAMCAGSSRASLQLPIDSVRYSSRANAFCLRLQVNRKATRLSVRTGRTQRRVVPVPSANWFTS